MAKNKFHAVQQGVNKSSDSSNFFDPTQTRQNYRAAGFRPVANSAQHQAMVELGRSSATSRHTPKARKGTRGSRDARALREVY